MLIKQSGGVQTADNHWPARSLAWWMIFVLALAYAISIIDRIALGFLVGPIEKDLHISDSQMGLLQGAGFAIFFAALGLPIGALADRLNRKVMIAVGMVVWSAATACCGLAGGLLGLFAARVMVGAGEAVLSPAGTSMIGDYFSPEGRPRAFSLYSLGSSIGAGSAFLFVASPLHAVTLWTHSGPGARLGLHPWQAMFLLLGAPGLLLAALMMATVREPPRREVVPEDARLPPGSFFQHLSVHGKAYAALFAPGVATGVATYSIIGWYPAYLVRSFGVTAASAASGMGMVGLPMGLVSSLGGGWLISALYRRGRPDAPILLAALSLVTTFTGCAVSVAAPSFAFALAGYGMISLAQNAPIIAILTGINRITPNRMRGQCLAVFAILTSLVSQTIGPLGTGLLSQFVFTGKRGVGHGLLLVIGLFCALGLAAIFAFRNRFYGADRLMRG